MTPAILVAAFCLAFPASMATMQRHEGAAHAQRSAEPVNTMCPIGKEPIVRSAGTVEHKGRTIGLCCPGCGKQFLAWEEARKDEFVALAAAAREPGTGHRGVREGAGPSGDPEGAGASPGPTYPYTLADCPVGGRLGSMGDPVVRVHDNREARFCCVGCIDEFEARQATYWAEIDRKIVAQQLVHYPIDRCIVTGEKLGASAVNRVHNNRLVRLASAEAEVAFKADPRKHLDALDRAIVESQRPGYPMDTCPVGGPLGSMGEPIEYVLMNRLVRLCCGGCEKSLVRDPAAHMAKLDAAYVKQQRERYPLESCVVSGARLGSMGNPVDVVAGTTLVRLCCENCVPRFEADPAEFLSRLPRD